MKKEGIVEYTEARDLDPREILATISRSTTMSVGESYLQALVSSLSSALGVDIVFVGEFDEGTQDVKTIALTDSGQFQDNFSYVLEHTPCAEAMAGKTCCYPSNVQKAFPLDILLQDMEIESYSGTRLNNSKGQPIGIIVVLCRREMKDTDFIRSIVEVFSDRAAAELERRSYERELIEANLELRKVNEDLLDARLIAEEANLAKSRFLANMSHEIRTPLNGIMGMVEVLQHSGLDTKAMQRLDVVRGSSQSLLTILNNVLDISKIEAGKMEVCIETFSLSQLLTDIKQLWQAKFNQQDLEFIVGTAPKDTRALTMDLGKIRQILDNLISNALKFTKSGTVSLHASIENNDQIVLSVKDTGIGIASEDQKRLFKKFAQLDTSLTRNSGGTGLGLAISSELAQLLGGDIQLRSEEQQGATFSLRLPLESLQSGIQTPKLASA